MIIHFDRKVGYRLSNKPINYWEAYIKLEISYGPAGNGVVARRKCHLIDKEIYRIIRNQLKEFKSIRYFGFLSHFIFRYFFGGHIGFRFKDTADEALFILKYTDGMNV
jgi:hypothetical protein